jgi:hypothetical protein
VDLIIILPKYEGNNVILVVVDQLTKYAYFYSLSHPFKASAMVTTFMEII